MPSSSDTEKAFLDEYLDAFFRFSNGLAGKDKSPGANHRDLAGFAVKTLGEAFFSFLKGSADIADNPFRDIIRSYPLTPDESQRDPQTDKLDPSVLGTICENLLRKPDESASKQFSGVFYTNQTEIRLMCRLALANYLANHLGEKHRLILLDSVFADGPSQIEKADNAVEKAGLWGEIRDHLNQLTVLDPSSGAGSFLVGMLYTIDDLIQRADTREGTEELSFDRRKRIAERNLWGIEIDDLACETARIRLTLACAAGGEKSADYRDLNFNISDSDFLTGTAGRKFDIVIGNPPYVRQEKITDPLKTLSGREYKNKIAKSVYSALPEFFGPDPLHPEKKLDSRSDLYLYFFFAGISHLESKGTLCFITSNSWLDSGYGKTLREFLASQTHLRMIIDSEHKRSFESADINTIISLISLPPGTDCISRFVSFSEPLEQVSSGDIFRQIESSLEWQDTKKCRIRPVVQDDLFESESGRSKITIGNWGGRYLRSPGIFHRILEKSDDRLVRLSDCADVRRGITTGANDFFHLTDEDIKKWNIEPKFLRPLIKSSREIRSPKHIESTRYRIFICNHDRESLMGSSALEYIRWGESRGFNERTSCAARKIWWSIGERRPPAIISPCSTHDLYRASLNISESLVDKRLYEVNPKSVNPDRLAVCLNCSLTSMFMELGTRTGLGEGLLDMTVYEVAGCPIVDPNLLPEVKMFDRGIMGFEKELEDPQRRELDRVVFDALGMTESEMDDFYDALIQMIQRRLRKAGSLKINSNELDN